MAKLFKLLNRFKRCAATKQLAPLPILLILSMQGSFQGAYCQTSAVQEQVFEHPIDLQHAPLEFEQVRQRLQSVKSLRLSFEQQRFIAVLSKPLISRGQLLFDKDLGIVWKTISPISESLVITPEQSFVVSDQGQRSFGSSAGIEQISKIFMALFRGDFDGLARYFEISFRKEGERWRIGCKPRDAGLAQFLRGIVLEGKLNVDHVSVFEGSGDRAEIVFQAMDGEQVLSENERQYFQAES